MTKLLTVYSRKKIYNYMINIGFIVMQARVIKAS